MNTLRPVNFWSKPQLARIRIGEAVKPVNRNINSNAPSPYLSIPSYLSPSYAGIVLQQKQSVTFSFQQFSSCPFQHQQGL